MEREDRYIVIKRKDVEKYIGPCDQEQLQKIIDIITYGRLEEGKRFTEYVCVGDDWPMYEQVWQMIEEWVDGAASSSMAGYDDDLERLQQRLVELTIELSRHKEAIHNYMSMGHAGEQDEVVQIFMDEYLPDEPEDEALSS
ncbi:MAG: hypothetical protein AB2761_20170 [Candidatus Thiodiazotropha endolucinida]